MTDGGSDSGLIFLFGILALLVLVVGWKSHFFSFPAEAKTWPVPLRWFHVVGIFAIYFGAAAFIAPFLAASMRKSLFPGISPIEVLGFASWVNFLNSLLILVLLSLFILAIPSQIRKSVWRRTSEVGRPYSDDVSFAAFAWVVSFPLVLFCSQLFDWIITALFHVKEIPEQLAVHFLKMTFGHPLYLILTTLTIIIFAPLIEETLFRGFLQTFIRQHLGSKQAIGITSLLFALFHYSPEQGLGNIPIVVSLFVLALFLGFVYEKKGSLFAPISLHASFNLISVLNLYFLGGFPKGPI
jgi:hypothetical protein